VRRAWILLLLPTAGLAQGQAGRGLDVFNKSCATGYCHGVKGVEAGAPRLAARGFDEAYIAQTVRQGIPHTGMPAFGDMERADLLAVIAYVDGLNGIAPSANPALAGGPARPKLPAAAQHGRELFSDQVRGLTRCSNCHQADGVGIAVTLSFSSVPDSVAALRQLATPQIETATAEGDTFPALVLNRNGAQTKLYDFTIPPPVLRTFAKGTVAFKAGSSWRHETMLAPYNDQELEAIVAFLKAAAK
jgi:mono/diheme cytochrome c family protein